MTVYEFRTSMTTVATSAVTTTLNIAPGMGQQLLVRANTSDTVFRVILTDESGLARRHYGFHRGELNDTSDGIRFPVSGVYTLSITNASPNDTFTVLFAVQEGGR